MSVRIEEHDRVRLVVFDRPDVLNAFDTPLYHAVAGALDDALADDTVSAVVLTGAGRAFSAGQDLDEMGRLVDGTAPEGTGTGFVALVDAVQAFDKPLLAAVNGVAVGIGATLLAHCDVVVMSEEARLRLPFAPMGVPPEAASSLLFPARIGWQRAALALLAADWISAAEAVDAGLAVRTCPPEQVLEETLQIAARMAVHPLAGLRLIKRLMLEARLSAVADARRREEDAFARLLGGGPSGGGPSGGG